MAGVHGTVFSIDSNATEGGADTVAVDCSRGAVDVTKSGYLQIGSEIKPVTLIDTISANGRADATYHPTKNWLLGSFASFADAEASFQQQVTAARRSGDAYALSAALRNLGLILWFEGRYGEALDSEQQGLAIVRQLGDREAKAERSTTSA